MTDHKRPATNVLAVLEGDEDYLQDNQRETDNDPVSQDNISWSTITFNLDDPEGERRLRECLDAPKWKSAVQEFDQWMRVRIKYNPDPETDPLYISEEGIVWLEIAREQLNMRLEDRGIDIWEE